MFLQGCIAEGSEVLASSVREDWITDEVCEVCWEEVGGMNENSVQVVRI